ncbi:hypothetical protein COOONC_21132 [Cooperia oncophora]
MSGLLCKIKGLLGIDPAKIKPGEENPPKNMSEVIERLPDYKAKMVLPHLNDVEVKSPLSIQWNFVTEGLRDLHSLENDRHLSSDALEVYIAVVSPEQWSHFSAISVFLGRGRWAFVQYTSEKEKLVDRLQTLIWEVMVDVPHLNTIVTRDMRERMEPWQIAALSPSHQVGFGFVVVVC